MTTWQMLAALVRRTPWLYVLTLALQFPRRLIRLVPGLVLKALFDYLSSMRALSWEFWGLIALLVGVALARATLLVGTMAAERLPLQRSMTLLRTNILKQILGQPGANGLPLPAGDAANRLQEDPGMIAFTLAMIIYTIGVAAETVVAITVMAGIDGTLTLVAVLPVFVASWALQLAGGRVAHYRRQGREATGQAQAALGQFFGAVMTLQASGAERAVTARFASLGEARQRAALRERLFSDGILGLFSSGGASMATGAVLLFGRDALRMGSLSIGDFALFISYLTLVEDFISLLIGEVVRYRQTGVALERLQPLLAGAPPMALVEPLTGQPARYAPRQQTEAIAQSGALLLARGLRYRYPGTQRGIHGIDLQVGQGELIVVTGRIGSGKTTLLRACTGLLRPDAGAISWAGIPVNDPTTFFGPPHTAYTPQVPTLFSATLRDNILLGLPRDSTAIHDAVALAALDRDIAQLEAGLDTPIGPRGVKLSGGQVQRAAAARMLVRSPRLLVVDDLSSALDVETEEQLWRQLRDTGGSRPACLAVSHRQALLRRADRVLVMDQGVVVAEGAADELLRTSALFQQLWQLGNPHGPSQP
jgi:ATP-binding cassette, subfamily B, bacterial